jgi:hypothetical protein
VIVWTAPADGQYYLEVTAGSAEQIGGYELQATGDDDYGDNPENAAPLGIVENKAGVIERAGDSDWFVVSALAGVEYRIVISPGDLPGVRVRVLGPDGVTELASGVGDAEVPAVASWTAAARDSYFIEVTGATLEPEESGSEGETPDGESEVEPPDPIGSYLATASIVSSIPGDYDGDHDVDGADLMIWQRTVGGAPAASIPLDASGFEGPGYIAGDLAGQNGWAQLGSAGGTAIVQSDAVATGSQAVRVDRAPGVDNWWGVPLESNAAVGPRVLLQWDMRVTATGAENEALGPFFGMQAYDDEEGFGLLGSLGVDATTLDVVYQRQDDGVIVEAGQKISADVWYSFAVLFDFDADQYTVYFEGRALATTGFVDRNVPGADLDRLTDADIAALAAQLGTPSQQAAGTAYFDNVQVRDGVSSPLFAADGNGDGVVDELDLDVWTSNFGVSYAVPLGGSSAAATSSAALSSPAMTPAAPSSAVHFAPLSFGGGAAVRAIALDAAATDEAADDVVLSTASLAGIALRIHSDGVRALASPRLPSLGADSPLTRALAQLRDRAIVDLPWSPRNVATSWADANRGEDALGDDGATATDGASTDDSDSCAELDAALVEIFP